MQPISEPGRPGHMPEIRHVIRVVIAMILAMAAATVPMRQVLACSCVGFGTPEEVVAGHDLTFIGTVVDTGPGREDEFGGRNVMYAFDVERASMPTDAVLVVQALDDPGGAACGFAFGMGERWLVSAYRQGADLETSLCSNNQLAGDIPADQLAAFTELLPNPAPDPAEPATETAPSDFSVPLAAGLAVLATFALVAVSVLAFRTGRRGTTR